MQNRKETQMYRTDFGTLWEKARVGCSERTALKQVYYQGWNRSPAQVGCMRQVLRAGTLGRPRGMGWGGRWEGGSGWGTHVNSWLIHVNVWQKPLQYCKVTSLQLIKINANKTKQNMKPGRVWSVLREQKGGKRQGCLVGMPLAWWTSLREGRSKFSCLNILLQVEKLLGSQETFVCVTGL